jgi:hypothetical protein
MPKCWTYSVRIQQPFRGVAALFPLIGLANLRAFISRLEWPDSLGEKPHAPVLIPAELEKVLFPRREISAADSGSYVSIGEEVGFFIEVADRRRGFHGNS